VKVPLKIPRPGLGMTNPSPAALDRFFCLSRGYGFPYCSITPY
jgi:hypothetical protein